MADRIAKIAQLINTNRDEDVAEGITLAENLKDLSVEEKQALAEALSEIFYFHDHSGISRMAKLAIRAEQIIANLDCEVIPFLISELVDADSESAAYFGKAIAFNKCSDIHTVNSLD